VTSDFSSAVGIMFFFILTRILDHYSKLALCVMLFVCLLYYMVYNRWPALMDICLFLAMGSLPCLVTFI